MVLREHDILIRAAAVHPGASRLDGLRRLIARGPHIDRLIRTAVREGMAGLLYKNMERAGALGMIKPPDRDRLRSLYYTTVASNLRRIHDLKEVLHRLGRRGTQVVLIQGIALLLQVYQDAGLRPLTDIDLWVIEEDYPDLVNALTGLGYRRDPLYPYSFKRSGTRFEIQTRLPWADRIKASAMLIGTSQEQIYLRTCPVKVDSEDARCLGPQDQVLYLGLHALKHNAERMIWLVDIHGLVAGWGPHDWEDLADRARELGLERPLAYILFLLTHLCDFRIPDEAHALLAREAPRSFARMALMRIVQRKSMPPWVPLFVMSSGKGIRRRFPFILENLFPRPEILRQVFADAPGGRMWRLYGKRLLQLIEMLRSSLSRKAWG